jgi:hypothetical protein
MKRQSGDFQALFSLLLRTYRPSKSSDSGYVLFATIGVLLSLLALLLTYTVASKVESSISKRSAESNTGFYSAEAGLNLRAKAIRTQFQNFGFPDGTAPARIEDCLDNSPTNDGDGDYRCISYLLDEVDPADDEDDITAVSYAAQNIDPRAEDTDNDGEPGPNTVQIPAGEPFAGLSAQEYPYTVSSALTATQGTAKLPRAILGMNLKSRLVPIFQFAAFYQNDLEILPGPLMILNGRVHTNSDLYLGAGDGLRITEQVTVGGTLFNKRKNDGSTYACGKVQINNPSDVLKNLDPPCGSANAYSNNAGKLIFGDRIKVGIPDIQIPDSGILAPPSGRPNSCTDAANPYYCLADLRVTYDPNNTSPTLRAEVGVIKRNQGSVGATNLPTNEVRSLFQPLLSTADYCPALDTVNPDRKVAAWKLLSGIAATGKTYKLLDLNSTAPIWNLMASGDLYKYEPAVARLVSDPNNGSNSLQVDSAANFSQDDIIAVGNDIDNRVSGNPTGTTINLVSNLGSDPSPGVGVAKIGSRVPSGGAVSTTTRIRVRSANNAVWDVGDQITVNGTNTTIQRIDLQTNTIDVFPALPAAPVAGNDVRLASVKTITNTLNNAVLRGCLRPAALQETSNFRNNREGKDMRLLQMSLESLTLWNRDGMTPRTGAPGVTRTYGTVFQDAVTNATALTLNAGEAAAMGVEPGATIKIVPVNGNVAATYNGVYNRNYLVRQVAADVLTLDRPLDAAVSLGSVVVLTSNDKIFDRADAADNANILNDNPDVKSFSELGLSAIDQTQSGLVFYMSINPAAYSTAAGNSSPYGFALTRGAMLPGPLTVASDQAMYVQGDYNCLRQLGPLRSLSCDPKDTNPSVTDPEGTYDVQSLVDAYWRPAAILGDSMNVLSNNCVDDNNSLNCGINNAQPNSSQRTTVYSALLAGTDITNGSNYNGGLENYPRFHENWDGSNGARYLFYSGSFVSIDTPEHVSGRHGNQRYTPPNRRWRYETKFNSVANLPPITPRFVYLRQELFTRSFER